MSHLQLVRASTEDIPNVLRLPGSVTFNGFATTPVITQVSGIVARVVGIPGERVRSGQPLLYVSSPQYAQMRTDYLKARDALWLAKQNYTRAQDLYAHHAIATRDLEQSQSAQEQAQADLNAAWQALTVLGFNDPKEVLAQPASPEIPVLAPLAGQIVDRTVAPGEVVQGGSTQCFTISETRTVWVLANVYQSALGYIHRGDRVAIQTDAYPMTFHGRISYIAPALDPATRTLQVRIVTDNPGERLKKDMYVTVVVDAGVLRNALTVPTAAVLRNDENRPFVYVEAKPFEFAERLVELGAAENGRTQIVSGLKSGEHVVADGSLFLQFANSLR
ncbi:MAG TPA: efflux RND transporter periplasmic adaptor subunit [Terriglobia bacterium]|nr:efflux RND transporter periplasmic adaptor subunit [Terriglobia bacterium]